MTGSDSETADTPKLFISYSWTDPDHIDWVIRLSTQLRESGIDVILDKWDLREGQDANAFMEKMVTDTSVNHVAMICDQAYVEKANQRKGGVGVESQIISAEVYESTTQTKFVALALSRDDNGKTFLPAYYKSRIHIDFTDPNNHYEAVEQLIRWVYEKPVHTKPKLGQPPAYVRPGATSPTPGTSTISQAVIHAFKEGKSTAQGMLMDYLSQYLSGLEEFRIEYNGDEFDELFMGSIDAMLPYRNEFLEVVETVAIYVDNLESRNAIHRFFEKILPYQNKPTDIKSWTEVSYDNFRFIVHEQFLHCIASLARLDKIGFATHLLSKGYYTAHIDDELPMATSSIFHKHLAILAHRKQRLKSRRISLHADILKARCDSGPNYFEQLMQADFILYLRSCLVSNGSYQTWWPETLVYASHLRQRPFEIFARSQSVAYFTKLCPLLGISSKQEFDALADLYKNEQQRIPSYDHQSINPLILSGYSALASTP